MRTDPTGPSSAWSGPGPRRSRWRRSSGGSGGSMASRVRVVSTGQHRELLDRALADFGLVADLDLGLMRPGQTLAEITARALSALDEAIAAERPDFVMAQGDTTTVLATALASYYRRVPFGHVEAGLRTGNPYRPFPEEKNRVLAGHLAEVHFAPTPRARLNLLREGVDDAAIHVTGNTGIDALRLTLVDPSPLPVELSGRRMLLVTAHRRENFGAPMAEICEALRILVGRGPVPLRRLPGPSQPRGPLGGGEPPRPVADPADRPGRLSRVRRPDAGLVPDPDRLRRGPGGRPLPRPPCPRPPGRDREARGRRRRLRPPRRPPSGRDRRGGRGPGERSRALSAARLGREPLRGTDGPPSGSRGS